MNRFRAVIDDSSQFSLRSLLWLDHCEGSCVLAIEQVHESLFPRVSNQPRVIGQKPDWLPVALFDYIATLQFSIRSRWAVEEVSDYFTLNVGT